MRGGGWQALRMSGFIGMMLGVMALLCGFWGGRATRSYAALCRRGKVEVCVALRSAVALLVLGGVLAPLWAAAAAAWLPPAANEG